MRQQQNTGRSFEEEVRRVARLLWPAQMHQGAAIRDGRERDAVIVTDEAIHIVEATTLRTKAKAQEDIEKTAKLVSQLRKENPEKVVKGWFVTKDDLTADQLGIAQNYRRTVQAIPFKDFLAKLIDARTYLSFREKCSFGSVSDPVTNHFEVPRDSYVAPFFFEVGGSHTDNFSAFYHKAIRGAARTVVLGDFGAGKSMALRELFFRASSDFYSGTIPRFPVYLNLRKHIGQASPVEALIREAENTGYGRYDDLVKAWRADLTVIVLDGFDELIAPAWTQKASQLREHRAACTRLVAEFMRESPRDTPIIVSGRQNYFGSQTELEAAIRPPPEYLCFRLNDFTKEQAGQYLRKLQVATPLPDWLPARPLLLGYLAARAKQQSVKLEDEAVDAAEGWDYLIGRFCTREAEIHAGLYAEFVRRLLERIATKARYQTDWTSPVSQQEMSTAFKDIFGREPDDNNLGMMMRLPGLVGAEANNDDRRFVDADLAKVLAAGDVYEFITSCSAFDTTAFEQCRINIDPFGAEFVLSKHLRTGGHVNSLAVALDSLASKPRLRCLKGDMLSILATTEANERDKWTTVDDVEIDHLDLKAAPALFRKVRISGSTIGALEIDEANPDGIPQFQGCVIDVLRGPVSADAVRLWLNDSTVERTEFEALTNNAILDLQIPLPVKVALTALRKLYLQKGGGRQKNAFVRGLKPEHRVFVDRVLAVLVSQKYAVLSNRGTGGEKIYLKNAEKIPEVQAILSKRAADGGSLVEALKELV